MRAVINRDLLKGRVAALCAVALLASCEAAGTLAGGGAGSDYLVARQALETGNYDLAIRRYTRLLGSVETGSATRLQLEYAHALLRGNRFDEAIAATEPLTNSRTASVRASALAVRGTARHEAARRRLDAGERDAQTRALLSSARTDLQNFLRNHRALDASGAMRARSELIAADLASLG